jgi:hypothetical protein
MRAKLPASICIPGHPDYTEVALIEDRIYAAVGGSPKLGGEVGRILRDCIDVVVDTPSTARCDYEDLEKTEKTYLGTRVEIKLRALLRVPKGRLDLVIAGRDVDVKFTVLSNWMIPREAVDDICALVAADEARARCYVGLLKVRSEYLNKPNRDQKCSISAEGFKHIRWLVLGEPYPANFWRAVSKSNRIAIFSPRGGTERVAKLFELVQRVPINRSVVDDVAMQKDYMRRVRRGGGARDLFAKKGLLLLSGAYDSVKIAALNLPYCDRSSFISTSI